MFKPLLLVFCIVTLSTPELFSQQRMPVREYVNPAEMFSLNRETNIDQALQILSELSMEFDRKLITNRSSMSGSIGLHIPNMPWRQALDYIVSYNNLMIIEHRDRYEIHDYREEASPEVSAQRVTEELGINFDTREIEISATFFEGNRRMLREIGVDWTTIHNGLVRVSNIAAANVSQDVFTIEGSHEATIGNQHLDINALFSAFEATNQGEVIASPNIKVLDGEEGRVQVGQDFSIKQRDFAGNIIDQFFSTGTILQVTPKVISLGDSTFIHMDIQVERSTAQPDAVSTIVNKQEAQTQILLLSGESTVIAGLYETDESKIRRGIPLLKDLPPWFFGLRYLFGYNSSEFTVNELVIVIEAKLVPSLGERLNLPYLSLPDQIDRTRRGFREDHDDD